MQSEKKLYRTRGSLIGGVCAGIADYFNIDPIIVQILTVLLTVITGGLFAIVYLLLWVIVPAAPDSNEPVEVHPHDVHSETYGQVPYYQVKQKEGTPLPRPQASQPSVPYDPSSGVAHVPPTPPTGREGAAGPSVSQAHEAPQAYAVSKAPGAGAGGGGQAYTPTQGYAPVPGQTPPRGYAPLPGQAYAPNPSGAFHEQNRPPAPGTVPVSEPGTGIVSGALWFGFLLLFIGIVALFSIFVSNIAWWQFWPLILVISGIGMMVVPGRKTRRMAHFVNGLMSFAFGVSALTMSLDIVSVSSLSEIFSDLWPMLLIMCGFFVLGAAMKSPLCILLGGFVFVAFCFIGIGWFSTPGLTNTVSLSLPFGQSYVLDLNPWV